MLRRNLFDSFSALYTLPWPAPQAFSSVAALDYSYGTDWHSLLQYIWYAGMGAYAVGLMIHTLLFRRRIGISNTPAPDHIADAAAQVFKEMKRAELTAKLKSDADRDPTAEELAECENVKLPRLLISSAVDGPIYFGWRKTLVLPDNASYTDRQLHFILRYACHLAGHGHIRFGWLFLIAMCTEWFNPLIHLLHRMEQSASAALNDSSLTDGCTPAEKEEYIGVLRSLSNPQRCSIHYCLIGGPERETNERIERLTVKTLKDRLLSIFALLLIPIFFFGMFRLIQPPRTYPVSEESVFSVLGEDSEKLYGDRGSIDLCSTREDGLLYGTPYFKAYSAKNDQRICFHYPPDTAPELLEASAQRIFDALTQRLSLLDGKRDTDASLEVAGALTNKIEQQMNLLLEAAGYTPAEEEQAAEKMLRRYVWSVKTKDGSSARVILRIQPGGAYWSSETEGGLLIEIELQ